MRSVKSFLNESDHMAHVWYTAAGPDTEKTISFAHTRGAIAFTALIGDVRSNAT